MLFSKRLQFTLVPKLYSCSLTLRTSRVKTGHQHFLKAFVYIDNNFKGKRKTSLFKVCIHACAATTRNHFIRNHLGTLPVVGEVELEQAAAGQPGVSSVLAGP